MSQAKVLLSFTRSLVLARILRDLGQEYGRDGCCWMEGGREERKIASVPRLHISGLTTSLWTGNHELEVACPPADIQLLCCPTPPPPHTHPTPPQGSCLEIQLSSGRRRCCLLSTHMSEVSAVFLNQKITLSFVSN